MHRRVLLQSKCLMGTTNLCNILKLHIGNYHGIARSSKVIKNSAFGYRGLSYAHDRNLLNYGEEVSEARKRDAPIVALESTIITHGMPFPDNLATATRVEDIIRQQGAVPATIAILDGKIQVGMNSECLERLAKCAKNRRAENSGEAEETAIKCSRRDISRIVWQKLNGGTTVGGTMTIARMAGIPIMATGGIGGVHRGAQVTFDVSSDLTELARNPVAVVCAGVKAILDIPKTLEYLETQGVPVTTIGDTDNFPAFYSRETSLFNPVKSPSRVSNAQEAASLLRIQQRLALERGILFAVPIPEAHALDSTEVETLIQEALEIAEKRGIQGKYVTPFLLEQLNQLTSGGFLKANQALVENNARVAAEIALALRRLRNTDKESKIESTTRFQQLSLTPPPAVVVGGATIDTVFHVDQPDLKLDGRTHRAKCRDSYGGVGRNIAAALVALGLENTRFITVVGEDVAGKGIVQDLGQTGETIESLSELVTPRYTVILDKNGESRLGIGSMDAFDSIKPEVVKKHENTLKNAGLVILDGNLPVDTMRTIIDLAAIHKIPIWYEPTDIAKATKIFKTGSEWIRSATNDIAQNDSLLEFISPNVKELLEIAKYLGIKVIPERDLEPLGEINGDSDCLSVEWISEVAKRLAERIPIVITTLGSRGILVTRKGSMLEPLFDPLRHSRNSTKTGCDRSIQSRWYPVSAAEKNNSSEKFSVSGCGDCLAAAIIAGSYRGLNEAECVSYALEAAAISLRSYEPVPANTLAKLRNFSVSPDTTKAARTLK